MSHTLLSHLSKKSNGSHMIVPCSAQFDNFFPMITQPHGYTKLLVDANTREPYPMHPTGDFALEDHMFHRSKGMNLMPFTSRGTWFPPIKRTPIALQAVRRGLISPPMTSRRLEGLAAKPLQHPPGTWIPPATGHPPERTNSCHA